MVELCNCVTFLIQEKQSQQIEVLHSKKFFTAQRQSQRQEGWWDFFVAIWCPVICVFHDRFLRMLLKFLKTLIITYRYARFKEDDTYWIDNSTNQCFVWIRWETVLRIYATVLDGDLYLSWTQFVHFYWHVSCLFWPHNSSICVHSSWPICPWGKRNGPMNESFFKSLISKPSLIDYILLFNWL